MMHIDIDLAIANGIQHSVYPGLVDTYVRSKYSISEELAILRQRDSKPDEFEEYNAYVEACKRKAKEELKIT